MTEGMPRVIVNTQADFSNLWLSHKLFCATLYIAVSVPVCLRMAEFYVRL